ncbi:CRISPR-associated endonuclease Cas2 [Haloarcula marismortui]|uniref:CRISPR-associated endoribonuclease Cas2 n=1 Tax=Haloarcula marismortui ATCC 33800 TaxID=662476 RepID=M0JKD6_9EURY|nr:CRISPR-associated endonuclease Cas2 [Haloarcula sinaiiensis]EMA08155.1 CRISPR-associated protein Cas2 [Haloarcula sinaiiensis ATCC 33800]QUJ73980.1 CRISPR-associated endonuclease Cas2 [Haloarcula sinaiiensis ATCC 33800]
MQVIVVYDVPADRTHIYRKLLRRQLEHLQNSVFFGELTKGQVTALKQDLKKKLDADDEVVVFESTNPASFEVTTYGDADDPGSRFT